MNKYARIPTIDLKTLIFLCFCDNFFFVFNFAVKVVQKNERQFLPKVRSLWRKQIFVCKDEEFAINVIQPKCLSLLLTGKFRRGVTERVHLTLLISGCA